MSLVFVILAIVFVVVIAVVVGVQRSTAPSEARASLPASAGEESRDPRELLEGLPPEVRGVLERMVDVHSVLSRDAKSNTVLPRQATELITVAAPLALEVARLEDYLDRYDVREVANAAVRDPIKRPLLQDLERMGTRRAAILEALEAGAEALEGAQTAGSTPTLEHALHRLRLL